MKLNLKCQQIRWIENIAVRITAIRDITERKQAKEESRRRNRELTVLNRVIAASTATSEIETILETACRELAQAFDLPHVAAALLDDKKGVATVVAEYLTWAGSFTFDRQLC